MASSNNADSVFKTEKKLISTYERQKCHRWWSLMELFKNVCFFYDFIKTGLFANRNKIQSYDGTNGFFKLETEKKQQKRQLSVPITQSKAKQKKTTKVLVSTLPRLSCYLGKSCCYFVDHYQGKLKLTKRSNTFISDLRLIENQKLSKNSLRSMLDICNNLRIESIDSTDCNRNVRRWLLHRKYVLLKKCHYHIRLRYKKIPFQLIIECNPMDLYFLYFCAIKLFTDVHKIKMKQVSSCSNSIPATSGKNEFIDAKIKCLIYDTVYKFAVRKMEGTGTTALIPILQHQKQQHLAIPVYSATKTISDLLLKEQPFAMTSRVSSAVSNERKKSSTYAVANANDDYYYQDALKRYRNGGTETLKRVNAEMSKTLNDGVGTLNNINVRVREYLNEMECSDKTLDSKVNIQRHSECGSPDERNNSCNDKEDLRKDNEAMVSDRKRRISTKSPVNENKEVHEIIEIDKILKTEMESKPVSLENLYEVMRHIDNINEYRNIIINYNDTKKDNDSNVVDHDQNRQMAEMLETEGIITNKIDKEEIMKETRDFAKRTNSQAQDDVVQIKSVKYESDDDGGPEILDGDEKNKDWDEPTCRSAREKKKRRIKIITKKSMLSNTTIIEVQSPKTCNKTREEKLEELIKALSKKSGDERIRQIMEFLQEQTVSSKPFHSDLVEDIPRIRALTNINGRLKQEELARDSLFEFQKKMCVAKKGKARIKLPTSLALARTTLQENKKKLVHLRAQELFVPDRHINRLTKTTTPSDNTKDKDISKLSQFEAHVRPKGRVAKYLEKRRKRLIQNALNYKRSRQNSAVIQQSKTATITMPKDAISIKKTLEKKASSKSDSDRTKNTLQLNINEKNDFSNYVNDTKENVPLNNPNNISKIELTIDRTPGIASGSATIVTHDSKTYKTNQKFYDLKDNPDYSRNPVEDYARDKHKWLRHKTDSPKSSKNNLYCFDILDEITPNDVRPLKSEYPRRDNILPEKIPHPCESFLGKLINRGNRKVLEALLKVETPKIVCSTPNCITCRIKDNHVGKRSKVHNKNSASSERSFSSTDETASVKKMKNHLLIVPKHAKKENARSKITTTIENGNEFRFKNFLKGRELAFLNDGPVAKAKSAGFEGVKKEKLRKIHSDRSRSSSQRSKRHKPKNAKLIVPKGLDHCNESNYSPSTSYKKNVDSFTRQEVEEKLKQYMVDPYLHYPTSVTIMPVSVVYHTFDNTNGNPRMMSHSTARVPFVQQLQRQQRADHLKTPHSQEQESTSLALDQNPSYIFTSTQGGETPKHKNTDTNKRQAFKDNKGQWRTHLDQNQQKNFESTELTDFLSRSRKGAVLRNFVFDKSQYNTEDDNKKCASLTEVEQPTKIKNKKSIMNQENAEPAIILPKMICKRAGVKSAPSKHQFKGKAQKKLLNRPATENSVKNVKNCTLRGQPLNTIKEKNRNVHFKEDIQKVIQSVEFKMVDILSDPRKHNVDAFIDVEKEITSVLAKFKTNDKTIEEEEGTNTSMMDADDEMKETIDLKQSCPVQNGSGSNSTSDAAASSSLSIISKKDKQILTDICTVMKKKSPRKKTNTGRGEKDQASKIITGPQTKSTTRPDTSPSNLENVEASCELEEISFDHVVEEKFNTNPIAQSKYKIFKTPVVPDKETIPSFYSQAKLRSKGPLTNSGTTLPSSSSSFLQQHPLGRCNLRRRKSQTTTFSPPSRAFTQLSSRSRPFSVTTTKVDDMMTYSNKTANNICMSNSNWKNGKESDLPLQPKIMETSFYLTPKYEVEKVMAETNSSLINICERETIAKKSGGSGDKGDIATVFRDDSEIILLEDNAETSRQLDEKDSESIFEENLKSIKIDATKSWTDTDLTTYTDSFHVTPNSALFNGTRHTGVNLENTNCPMTEEKCFITAAYEPKPHLSEKIDATLAKIEAATKTIEKAMQNTENVNDTITLEKRRTAETKATTSEKELSPVDNSEYVWKTFREKKHVTENNMNECETENGEGNNTVSSKEVNCHDNILYFLDNLTSLTTESNTPLPIIFARRKLSALSTVFHISLPYFETVIFYCINTHQTVYVSKCLRNDYHQEMLQLLNQTQMYAREEYIYDRDVEKQLLLHSRDQFERHDVNLTNTKGNEKIVKSYTYKARILDLFYGLLFTVLYFGLIFNYVCHFVE